MDQNETENSAFGKSKDTDLESRPVIRRAASFLKPTSALVPDILKQIPGLDPRLAQLMAAWPHIMGEPLCQFCKPDKITGGNRAGDAKILQLLVVGAASLEIQHQQNQILERINGFFGFRWIDGLRLTQGLMPPKRATPPNRAVQKPSAPAPANLDNIENEALRESLRKLSAHIE